MTRLAIITFAAGLLTTYGSAQEPKAADGTVRGEVFTIDANAARAMVPATKILLDGLAHVGAQSDNDGKFEFDAVAPGSYVIIAQAPGMTTQQSVMVSTGSIADVELGMRVQAVVQSTTVTAESDFVDPKQSPGVNAIDDSAIRNMSNIDERINSLLPLVGVVRGQPADGLRAARLPGAQA